jgi:dienelactone hydrolase
MLPRRCRNLWVDSGNDFIGAAWCWPTQRTPASTVVVLVPGIVHEERSMTGGLIALAEALADAGLPAMLLDLHGTSQSAGMLDTPDIGDRWRADIRAAVRHARATGAARVIVAGVRLGVPLALDALADEPLAALVGWAPIVSGRRYARELRMLQRVADPLAAPGTIDIGGFRIPPVVLDRIAALDLATTALPAAPRVLVRGAADPLAAPWLARLAANGTRVETRESTEIQPWLFGDGDQPALPHHDIRALAGWCRALHDEHATPADPVPGEPAARAVITFAHRGRPIRETFVEIGPLGLTGVLCEPANTPAGGAMRLLVSSVGPGRTFADFARDEASRGHGSLRFDFAGFGTSGRGGGTQGGELYSDDGARDVRSAIDHLRAAGHDRIHGIGFCAGAWSMMQAGALPGLEAIVAINVALYRQPGAAPMRSTHARQRLARLARLAPGLAHSALVQGFAARVRRTPSVRRVPVDWLVRLCDAGVPVWMAYADSDPGLAYLTEQLSGGLRAQLGAGFTMPVYAGLGHLAEGPSARTRLFDDIASYLAALDAADAPARRVAGAAR